MPGLKWLLAGGGLYWLSRLFESVGDSFPYAAEGVSAGRLLFHGAALLILIGAIFCFVRAGRVISLALRGGRPAPLVEARRAAAAPQGPQAPGEFDPDEALARYLVTKAAQEASAPSPSPPSPAGFGRKGA